ncbi:MAG: DUF3822 family protein [Alloprevotella sp.]
MSLYIRISESELNFALYDPAADADLQFFTHHVSPQSPLTVNLRGAAQQVPLLQDYAGRVEVLAGAPVTPVPLADFQEEDAATFYNFCFETEGNLRVFYDTVPAINTVFLFALPENTCRTLEEVFGAASIHYTAALTPVMLTFAGKGLSAGNGKRIFLYVHDETADVAVLEGSRLIMLNAFAVRALTDVAYYTFNMVSHLATDIAQTPVFVAGPAALRDPVVTELQHYAGKVYAIQPAADFNRHVVSTTPGVPYDLMCALLRRRA